MNGHNGNVLVVNDRQLSLPHQILDSLQTEEGIFVIFDYMEFSSNEPAKNLVRLDEKGNVVWVADNPTTQSNDAYTNFNRVIPASAGHVAANNFAGYYCEIKASSGELGRVQFTK